MGPKLPQMLRLAIPSSCLRRCLLSQKTRSACRLGGVRRFFGASWRISFVSRLTVGQHKISYRGTIETLFITLTVLHNGNLPTKVTMTINPEYSEKIADKDIQVTTFITVYLRHRGEHEHRAAKRRSMLSRFL